MRARLIALSLCLLVWLALPSQANEKPTPEYQKAMKELGTVNNHLRNSLKDIDFAAIENDAAAMQAIFATVLAYWQDKKAEDAIKLSQDGIKAATDLEAAAKAQNHPGVVAASRCARTRDHRVRTGSTSDSARGNWRCDGPGTAHRHVARSSDCGARE